MRVHKDCPRRDPSQRRGGVVTVPEDHGRPGEAEHRRGVPGLRRLASFYGLRKHRVPHEKAESAQRRGEGAGPGRHGPGEDAGFRRPAAVPAFRRAAAAGGSCPGAGLLFGADRPGRTHHQPRREAPGGDGLRDPEPPEDHRGHRHLHHPRPGDGHDHFRPHGDHG